MRPRIAARLLLVVAVLVMGIGAYFAILRPAFLPEDLRFIGAAEAKLNASAGIVAWIRHVFVVLGGYAFTTGLFTAYIAVTAIRSRRPMPVLLVAVAGLTSVGVIAAVNFALGSDFRIALAGLAGLWAIAVVLDLSIGSTSRSEYRESA